MSKIDLNYSDVWKHRKWSQNTETSRSFRDLDILILKDDTIEEIN